MLPREMDFSVEIVKILGERERSVEKIKEERIESNSD